MADYFPARLLHESDASLAERVDSWHKRNPTPSASPDLYNAYQRDWEKLVRYIKFNAETFPELASMSPEGAVGWLVYELAQRHERFVDAAAQQDERGALMTAVDVAAFIEKKAEDYAREYGVDDMGSLSFGNDAMRDHHWGLLELADEIRNRAVQQVQAEKQDERGAQLDFQAMMSAHALCPTDLNHPDKMRWIAAEFRKRTSHQVQAEGDAVADGYGETDFGYTFAGIDLADGDKRLMSMLIKAFGTDHPAVDDLTALLFRTHPCPAIEGASTGALTVPEGYALVPVTPTDEMLATLLSEGEYGVLAQHSMDPIGASAVLRLSGVATRYADMLAASPDKASTGALTVTGDEVRAIVKAAHPGGSDHPSGPDYVMATVRYLNRRAASSATQASTGALTDDQIREVFLANGFTVKDGQTDLKPYVYVAARALLALAASPAKEN